jgi:hypothetical protein
MKHLWGAFFGCVYGSVMMVMLTGCPQANSTADQPEPEVVATPVEWELIENPTGYRLWRTKTPTGWLVFESWYGRSHFVPDPEHKWLVPAAEAE